MLHRRVRDDVDVRFGTEVTDFREEAGRVTVVLSDGREEWGDMLIGADGVHSKVRKRLFGESGELLLGGSYVAIDIDVAHGLELGEISAYLGRGKMVAMVPSAPGRLSVIVYHGGELLRPKLRGPPPRERSSPVSTTPSHRRCAPPSRGSTSRASCSSTTSR
ncbi:FAD-dependent oxidoreductase [Cystobacter fuscus]